MAENGVNGHQSNLLQWKVGFMNKKKKYLTAESFGFKVNTSGAALKKKQIWSIEQDPADDSVYIRSCQGRYMTSDKYGKVSVDVEAEEKGLNEKYQVVYSADGRWALKQQISGNYFRGLEEKVECFDKNPGEENWWCIQLYAHPQIHLRNVNRKRYAHLQDDELVCSELIPWGSDALVVLDFDEDDGKYTLKSCDGRFLSCDGTLENDASEKTKFSMEVHCGAISFKDCNGRYLSAVGKGTLKSKNTKVSKDELFTIEDSHPQCQIISHNDKSVSVKQGQDVTANQPLEEIEDTEIFQMEYNKESNTWAFRACNGKYWSLQEGPGTVEAKQAEPTKNSFFNIDWNDNGTVGIQGVDGKYLSNKPTGIVYSTGTTFEDCNRFRIRIVNRPLLILKSEFGYVGTKPKENQYICNKTKYDILQVDYDIKNGFYTIKNKDGKNWYVGDDNMVYLDESNSSKFQFQFCGLSMMAIRAPNGRYLCGEQNGLFKATAEEINATSKWEF